MLAVPILVLGLIVAPGFADVPDVAFEITAAAGPDGAAFPVLADWGTFDPETDTWTWSLPQAHEFWCKGRFLGNLNEFDSTIIGDPQLDTDFAVQSGPSDAEFYICSGELPIDPNLIDPVGWVSVTFVLTDTDGDGATLTGLGPNGGAYLAQYNGWACDPSGPQGTTFAECISSITAGPFETVTVTCVVPPTVVPGVVYDMSVLASFELTANDMATGTGAFVIIPCFGDLDGDSEIGLTDLAQLLANYGTVEGATYRDGDLDVDGDVDLSDLAALLTVYGTACP